MRLPSHATPLRILALGDSYTVGEGLAVADAWPSVVSRALAAEGVRLEPPQVIATTGWTTDELAAGMASADLAPPYAAVTLMIGVNDQYRGRPVTEYRQGFEPLLARAIALSGNAARTLVISIPDWGVTPFARGQKAQATLVARQIDAYNDVACKLAARHGCAWIDVTALSRQAGDDAQMLIADGLHPSARQHALWSERIIPALRAAVVAG